MHLPDKNGLGWNAVLFLLILAVMGIIALCQPAKSAEHFQDVGPLLPDGGREVLKVCREREGYTDCVPNMNFTYKSVVQ